LKMSWKNTFDKLVTSYASLIKCRNELPEEKCL
jgi:hypothetical protein